MYNGSGVYTLPGAALANGEIVSATENNQFRNDVAAALNVAWTRDGQAPASANIPMGNHKLTGLSAGTGAGDSVRFEQLPSSTNPLSVASGGTGASTITGLVKGNGTSAFTVAVAGTDYIAPPSGTAILKANSGGDLANAVAGTDYLITVQGLFNKADPTIVGFTKTGAGSATTSTTIYVEVNGVIKTVASGTSITMPTFASGTDYAIWCKPDGTLEATSNHTSPPVANSRKIGGFHYAPGGNATGTSGGNTTPQINEYSFWDLKFRPSCSDPRGMTLVLSLIHI
jgi:hypothetical protein